MGLETFTLLAVLKWPLALVYLYLKFAVWWITLPFKIVKKIVELTQELIVWIYAKVLKMI